MLLRYCMLQLLYDDLRMNEKCVSYTLAIFFLYMKSEIYKNYSYMKKYILLQNCINN